MNATKTCPVCGSRLPARAPEGQCPACLLAQALHDSGSGVSGPAVGDRWTPPPPETLAGLFPELTGLSLVGRGGMGAVYQARQTSLDRVVAVKILPPEIGRDPAFAERFAREAKALARLNHPNIVTVHEFGRRGDYFFFLMEYIDGASLRQLMAAGPVPPPTALAVIPQICDALQYAHDQGIVHRDIKPDNILLDRRGRVKIADFGLAKLLLGAEEDDLALAAAMLATGRAVGTPQYMAPEQLANPREVDQRADIYSLGVVFYQLLTGELPPERFVPPSAKNGASDVRLDPVVERALAREPAQRFQQMSQVKHAVEALAGRQPGLSRRSRLVWGAVAAAAAVLVLVALAARLRPEAPASARPPSPPATPPAASTMPPPSPPTTLRTAAAPIESAPASPAAPLAMPPAPKPATPPAARPVAPSTNPPSAAESARPIPPPPPADTVAPVPPPPVVALANAAPQPALSPQTAALVAAVRTILPAGWEVVRVEQNPKPVYRPRGEGVSLVVGQMTSNVLGNPQGIGFNAAFMDPGYDETRPVPKAELLSQFGNRLAERPAQVVYAGPEGKILIWPKAPERWPTLTDDLVRILRQQMGAASDATPRP